MKLLTIIIFCLTFISCKDSDKKVRTSHPKLIHIPDTTNNWYAKLSEYPNYLRKVEMAKQLHLDNLETDTINSEIRLWFFHSSYDPQLVILLNNEENHWTISKLNYYLNFHEQNRPKVDSISTEQEIKRTISSRDFDLLGIQKIWQLPSQSEMKNGSSFGCMDGYSLLIEMNTKEKYKYLFYRCPDFHVAKDSTFQTVVNFKNKVAKLLRGSNLSEE